MGEPPKRGRPKVSFDAYEDELLRRFKLGLALPTVEEEARYLAHWGKQQGPIVLGGNPIEHPMIRIRINKRYNGAAGYKSTRIWHLQNGGNSSESTKNDGAEGRSDLIKS